jgi:hypothetical protein
MSILKKTLNSELIGNSKILDSINEIKTADVSITAMRLWEHGVDPDEERQTLYLTLHHSKNPDGENIRSQEFFDSKLNILFLVIVRKLSTGGYLEVNCKTILNHKIQYQSMQMFTKVLLWQSDSKISGWHNMPI